MGHITSFPKDQIKILLLESISDTAIDTFKKNGYTQVTRLKGALVGEELHKAIKDVHIIGVRSKTQLTEEVLSHAEKLLAIGCFCIGTNQVDLHAATQKGIAVFNAPYSNTRSVAELIIAESIMLIRQIPEKDKAAHQGKWLKKSQQCYELRGKTLGIIGYGNIGKQVSVLAEAMGLHVRYYDVASKLPLGNALAVDDMYELIEQSDIVSLHVPALQSTVNLYDKKAISHMKQGSILLNLSRGNVVDLDALKEALERGQVMGAGIDVFPKEPKVVGDPFTTPLQNIPNVILTPHIGGSTEEAQYNIGIDVASKLSSYLDTGASEGSHSIPELSLPIQEGVRRILHVHDNVPGVLSAIHSTLSDQGINIAGEYLKTNEKVGYVVLDISIQDTDDVVKMLKAVPHTIRARVLY